MDRQVTKKTYLLKFLKMETELVTQCPSITSNEGLVDVTPSCLQTSLTELNRCSIVFVTNIPE